MNSLASARMAAIELCSGLGGIGIGLRALGYDVLRAYDSWEDAVAIYNHNFPGELAKQCNLLSSNVQKEIALEAKRLGEIDLLAAGPPCKGFSQLRNGRHDGRNGHNRVLAAMPEYIGLIKPRMFLIENVPDLERHRDGKTLAQLLEKLRWPRLRLKYRVEYAIFDAAHYGTPQARRRILILGVRDGCGDARLPKPGPELGPLFKALRHRTKIPKEFDCFVSILKDPENDNLTTARQALSDLPLLEAGVKSEEEKYARAPHTAYQRWAREEGTASVSNTRTPMVLPETMERQSTSPKWMCALNSGEASERPVSPL